MGQSIIFKEFTPDLFDQVQDFTDKFIGRGYFSKSELNTCLKLSISKNINCSFVAIDSSNNSLVGLRLTFAPGKWLQKYLDKTNPALWNIEINNVAYFKSLFISTDFKGQGIGPELSRLSTQKLVLLGAKAVVCHSWLESPANSSMNYLLKFGFKEVARHNNFWIDVDYECTRCGKGKCLCTGVEMIKYI